ncbi:heme-binding protein [uncultured Mycobacterium sp.]|uniref:SOUL family heme-binding protein n=1 Tax=uncultured Mycobacterium sp. TaxID=171292 RepID=UPI0035CAB8F6
MLGRIRSLALQAAEGAASIVGIRAGTEEPPYVIVRKIGDLEIRRYGSRIAAETVIDADEERARSEGFRRLAGYIFGGNRTRSKIAMTAPVSQEQAYSSTGERIAMTAPVSAARGADGWVIRFFMPTKWTLDTLPEPDDPAVHLVTVPAATLAVLRFSGYPRPGAIQQRTAELLRALRDTDFVPDGAPQAWFYDPPWTVPPLRRNEIAVTVNKV